MLLINNTGEVTHFPLNYLLFLQTWTEAARFLSLVMLLAVCHSSRWPCTLRMWFGAIPSSLRQVMSKVVVVWVVCPSRRPPRPPPPPSPPPPPRQAGSNVLLPAPRQRKTRRLVLVVQGRQSPLMGHWKGGCNCLPPPVWPVWSQWTCFFSEGLRECVEVSNTPLLYCCSNSPALSGCHLGSHAITAQRQSSKGDCHL